MYVNEGNKIDDYFLVTGDTVKKVTKWNIFPFSPMPKLIQLQKFIKMLRVQIFA